MNDDTKEEYIRIINSLFPADADYPHTALKGKRLLTRAKEDVLGWRKEPIEVLARYAQLCLEEEERLLKALSSHVVQ